ncbi:Pyruvate dehydrogenase E1 component subunit beta-1, mitochondrial [Capsicum chinense]|nr:Pyruvate dehydrogenase E1 component subunit beta-1, mitochondrial [Capsicum chinense]
MDSNKIVVPLTLPETIDHIINSIAKSNYISASQISVPIVFRGSNGAAAGVGAQHSQVQHPDLTGISHLLVDEIHERGMIEDFLLIILRDLLP